MESSKSLVAVSSSPSETMDIVPSEADSQLANLVYVVQGPLATTGQPSSSGGFASQPASVEAKHTELETIPEEMTRSMPNKKVKVVFVLGAPGSGKSTQCRKISHLYGFTHLSPGDLLQTETGSGSEYSTMIHTMIQNIMNEGKVVPSELTVKLLRRAMHKTVKYKFVVDGFPCDKENLAEWENAMGIEPKLVLYFGCSEEVIVSRLKNEVREDDLDTIRKRFKLFSKDSPSLIEHFGSNGTLKNINAERSVEEVFEEIKVIFSQKDMDLDFDDCQLNEAYLDACDIVEMKALAAQSQYTAQLTESQYTAQLTEKLDLGKRKSESELPPLTKKMRKHIVGKGKGKKKEEKSSTVQEEETELLPNPNLSDDRAKEKSSRRAETLEEEETEETERKEKKLDTITILDLPDLDLSPYTVLLRLRNLIKDTVGKRSELLGSTVRKDGFLGKYPYPWIDKSIEELAQNKLVTISGEFECLSCKNKWIVSLDWRECFVKIASLIHGSFIFYGDDIYSRWTPPPSDISISCKFCQKKEVCASMIPENWYFVFFTHMAGHVPDCILARYIGSKAFLELSELPSKRELIFTFYLAMLHQLDPKGGWTMMMGRKFGVNEEQEN